VPYDNFFGYDHLRPIFENTDTFEKSGKTK